MRKQLTFITRMSSQLGSYLFSLSLFILNNLILNTSLV